jgi:broad specificity phosphatase PhoE
MEIYIIRHGKSDYINNDRISGMEFKKWIEDYDAIGVVVEKNHSVELLSSIESSNIIITSDLKRSTDSAAQLKTNAKIITNPVFREAELPSLPLYLRLSPNIWLVILRIMWFLGYSNCCESYKDSKKRARKASDLLIEYAERELKVALIGHGIFNMLIAKELKKQGWFNNRKIDSSHWGINFFTKDESEN